MRTPFALALALAACSPADSGPRTQNADVTGKEQVVTLAVGESRELLGGAKVTLVAVPSDSRCPTGVQCVWAGSAAVAITLTVDGRDTTATLNSGMVPRSYSFHGWSVALRGITPSPAAGQPIPPDQYRATIGVGKD